MVKPQEQTVPYSTRHTCYTVSNFRQMCVTDAHPRNTITKKPVNKSISKRIMFGRLSMSCVVEPIRFQDLLKLSKNAKASAENALRNFGTRSTREVPRRLPRVASRNREHCTCCVCISHSASLRGMRNTAQMRTEQIATRHGSIAENITSIA